MFGLMVCLVGFKAIILIQGDTLKSFVMFKEISTISTYIFGLYT